MSEEAEKKLRWLEHISEISPWPIRIWGMDWLFLWRHGEEHKNEPLYLSVKDWPLSLRVSLVTTEVLAPPGPTATGWGMTTPWSSTLSSKLPISAFRMMSSSPRLLAGQQRSGLWSSRSLQETAQHLPDSEGGRSGNRPGHTAQHSVDSTAPQRQLIPREHALPVLNQAPTGVKVAWRFSLFSSIALILWTMFSTSTYWPQFNFHCDCLHVPPRLNDVPGMQPVQCLFAGLTATVWVFWNLTWGGDCWQIKDLSSWLSSCYLKQTFKLINWDVMITTRNEIKVSKKSL